MDDAGIDVAVLSVSTPGVHTGDSAKARLWRAGATNSRPNSFTQDRTGLQVSLASRCRISMRRWRSCRTHSTSSDSMVLCCSRTPTACTWATLLWSRSSKNWNVARQSSLCIPIHRQTRSAHSLGLPDNLLDFPTDTNRAVAQMHYTNRFARTPNVKYIFSHAGGSIPYLAARFAIIDEMGFIAGGEQRGTAADMFRRIYWDTALSASDPVLRMLRDVAGIDQVLFGTDFPYLRRDLAVNVQTTDLAEL